MSRNRWNVATAFALGIATLLIGACGSGGEEKTTVARPPPIAPEVAGYLAKLSDRVASDLDAGDTCHAAHAADDLRAAVEDADLPPTMSSDVDAVAGRLVDEVNCPPPPPPPPEPKKKNEGHDKHGDEGPGGGGHGGDDHSGQGHGGDDHSGQGPGGLGPPGKAKLKGE